MQERVIDGRYDVVGELGVGGMATVYRCLDRRLGRAVALKQLTDTTTGQVMARFRKEAHAIAGLRHEGIVQIYDYTGSDAALSDTYIVLELIEGGNAEDALLAHAPLSEHIVLSTAVQVAAALSHAHQHSVIHRDLKPANVLVEYATGRVLLSDFGIAKAVGRGRRLKPDEQTFTGMSPQLIGTPDFMAPEQISGGQLGPPTDVFALGALIYCLATDHTPFEADDVTEVLRRVLDSDYPPLRQLRADLSPELEKLVDECLVIDADKRPSADIVRLRCRDLLTQCGRPSAATNLREFAAQHHGETAAMNVRGGAFLAREALITTQHGAAAWRTFMRDLSQKVPFFVDRVGPGSLIPVEIFLVFNDAIVDRFFDGDPRANWGFGESSAEWAFAEGPYRSAVRSGNIREFISGAATLWSAYYDAGQIDITASEKTRQVTVAIRDLPVMHLHFEYAVMGYIRRGLELAGAEVLSTQVVRGAADGGSDIHYVFQLRGF